MRALRILVPAAVLAASAFGAGTAAAASGSQISLDAGSFALTYTAGPGQNNRPTVSVQTAALDGNATRWTWTVSDVAPITPGENCSTPDASTPATVRCTVVVGEFADFYPQHQFYLGDGVDRIDFTAADTAPSRLGGVASIHGGPGNDILRATGDEYLYGDAGNDTLTNGLIRGGDGNDTIVNADNALGEAGNDTITGTNATANGAGDLLDGGPGTDRISAGAGDDQVIGGAGNDRLTGGPGNDTMRGDSGNDTMYGNSGSDTMYGNSGNDLVSGGPGRDTVSGGPGRDRIG